MEQTKKNIIDKFKINDADTGSMEVQIALLTDRINKLSGHFEKNAKDFGSKRGLLILVGRRRRYLKYLETHNEPKYKKMIQTLELRK